MIPTFCIPCPKLKLMYIQVPKAANSSIIYCLNKRENWFKTHTQNHQELQDKMRVNKIPFNYQVYEHYKSLFWFTFVRNPYDRILSSYKNKVLDYPGSFQPFSAMGITKTTSFLKFCSIVENHNPQHLNDHIKPQYLIVPTCVHFIGKIENLKKDWGQLILKTPDLGELDVQLNKSNKYKNFLCKDSVSIINKIYNNDFKRFDYNKL